MNVIRRAEPPAGGARRRAWARARWRRLAAALLLGLAAWLASGPLLADAGEGVDTVVATKLLPVGTVLSERDVAVVRYPVRLRPPEAVGSLPDAVGSTLNSPATRGEVITAHRLRPGGRLAGLPDGSRAVHIPVTDPAALARVTPGDTVDVVAVGDGTLVAGAAVVLDVDATETRLFDAGGGRGLTVAVLEARVGPLTTAALDRARGGVHVVVRAPPRLAR